MSGNIFGCFWLSRLGERYCQHLLGTWGCGYTSPVNRTKTPQLREIGSRTSRVRRLRNPELVRFTTLVWGSRAWSLLGGEWGYPSSLGWVLGSTGNPQAQLPAQGPGWCNEKAAGQGKYRRLLVTGALGGAAGPGTPAEKDTSPGG